MTTGCKVEHGYCSTHDSYRCNLPIIGPFLIDVDRLNEVLNIARRVVARPAWTNINLLATAIKRAEEV